MSSMEKPLKSSRGTIMLKYLQKAATFTLTNLPHSPRGGAADKRPTARGFSGPMKSIIPANARQKKSSGVEEEPTSPKVTCIGQIKHKKKSSSTETETTTTTKQRQKNKVPSGFSRIFSQRVRPSGAKEKMKAAEQPGLSADESAAPPALGRMRKYASGRETFSDFDWEKFAAAESSDDEKDKEVGNIYHSAPLVLGGGAAVRELKEKDASIWRRRAATSAAALPELKIANLHEFGSKSDNSWSYSSSSRRLG